MAHCSTACVLGKTFEVVKPTAQSDRECKAVKVCDSKKEAETSAPTLLADRVCATLLIMHAPFLIAANDLDPGCCPGAYFYFARGITLR